MRRQLLAVVVYLASAVAAAEPIAWLYDVEVPVLDQSAEARQEGAQQALLELLSRLTGLQEVPSEPDDAITTALDQVDRYYSAFRFVEREVIGPDGEPTEQLHLRVRFDRNASLRLLRAAELPIWRSDRPRVLAWIALETPEGRLLVGTQDPQEIQDPQEVAATLARGLRERAEQRGVPVVLPLLDLEDQMAVEPAAVWGRLEGVLVPASERYRAQVLLIGQGRQLTGGVWSLSWEVWLGEERVQQTVRDTDLEVLAASGTDLVANALAQRYAVVAGQTQGLRLGVLGISDPQAYSRLLRYLGRLEFVDDVAVTGVTAEHVTLLVTTRADIEQLLTAFAADERLAASQHDGFIPFDAELVWQP